MFNKLKEEIIYIKKKISFLTLSLKKLIYLYLLIKKLKKKNNKKKLIVSDCYII